MATAGESFSMDVESESDGEFDRKLNDCEVKRKATKREGGDKFLDSLSTMKLNNKHSNELAMLDLKKKMLKTQNNIRKRKERIRQQYDAYKALEHEEALMKKELVRLELENTTISDASD